MMLEMWKKLLHELCWIINFKKSSMKSSDNLELHSIHSPCCNWIGSSFNGKAGKCSQTSPGVTY